MKRQRRREKAVLTTGTSRKMEDFMLLSDDVHEIMSGETATQFLPNHAKPPQYPHLQHLRLA